MYLHTPPKHDNLNLRISSVTCDNAYVHNIVEIWRRIWGNYRNDSMPLLSSSDLIGLELIYSRSLQVI